MPDDAFLLVIAACEPKTFRNVQGYLVEETKFDVPLLKEVMGLGCVSKGMRQQLYRLQPLVGVESLAVVQRPAHGPWCVTLLYDGTLTEAVVEQARQGRVRSISVATQKRGPYSKEAAHVVAPAVARRVVPDLLGAGCSVLDLGMSMVVLDDTWASAFGEAAVCSAVLRSLHLEETGLRGPLPELRLPALQTLTMDENQFNGGLEPLRGCTALRELSLSSNQLTGDLAPLRGCTALKELYLQCNLFTGGLKPLRGCTALRELNVYRNQLTGDLEPLRGCTALRELSLGHNQMTGGLEPLRGCTALEVLALHHNQLTGGLEPLRACKALQELALNHNNLTGDLEPLRGCAALQKLYLAGNDQLHLTDEDRAHFTKQHLISCCEILPESNGIFSNAD